MIRNKKSEGFHDDFKKSFNDPFGGSSEKIKYKEQGQDMCVGAPAASVDNGKGMLSSEKEQVNNVGKAAKWSGAEHWQTAHLFVCSFVLNRLLVPSCVKKLRLCRWMWMELLSSLLW